MLYKSNSIGWIARTSTASIASNSIELFQIDDGMVNTSADLIR